MTFFSALNQTNAWLSGSLPSFCAQTPDRYLNSEECRVEEDLLTAFKDYNPELLQQVQEDRTLLRLETPIVRLAKSLRIPGDEGEEGGCVKIYIYIAGRDRERAHPSRPGTGSV